MISDKRRVLPSKKLYVEPLLSMKWTYVRKTSLKQ